MDLLLKFWDDNIFTPHVYPKDWAEDWWPRQCVSMVAISTFTGYVFYFVVSTICYLFFFDKSLMQHPKFIKVSFGIDLDLNV